MQNFEYFIGFSHLAKQENKEGVGILWTKTAYPRLRFSWAGSIVVNTKNMNLWSLRVVAMSPLTIAAAHRLPLPLSDQDLEIRDQAVAIRYDGMMRQGEPVVFAVVASRDLAKLPEDVLDGLELLKRGEDGVLKGSAHAFFMRSHYGTSLIVDTGQHEGFLPRLVDICEDLNMPVLTAQGDLRVMADAQGEMAPPATPAFITNGHRNVPVRQALDEIQSLRQDRDQAGPALRDEDPDDDHPTLSPGH